MVAQDYFRTALATLPKDAKRYYYRGTVYYTVGRYVEAIASLDRSINVSPDFASSYNNRGTAYSRMGQYERAIQDYDKALSLNPAAVTTYFNRGYDHARLGRLSEAERDFVKAIELGYDSNEIVEALAELDGIFTEHKGALTELIGTFASRGWTQSKGSA